MTLESIPASSSSKSATNRISKKISQCPAFLFRGTLRGVIRSGRPDGPPISRAVVIGAPLEVSDMLSHTFANGEGKFELTSPAGSALIYARDGAGTRGGFTLVRGEGDSEVAIVAGPAAIARGRVVDGSGKPYVNVRVAYSVSTEGADADRTAGAGLSLFTDDLGRFVVPGLFIGARCKLYAIHPTGGGRSRPKASRSRIRSRLISATLSCTRGELATRKTRIPPQVR